MWLAHPFSRVLFIPLELEQPWVLACDADQCPVIVKDPTPTLGDVLPNRVSFLFFKDFIYLFMRHTEQEAETQAEGEAGSLREPDVGLDPGTPGSQPQPKADAQPLSHPHGLKDFFI